MFLSGLLPPTALPNTTITRRENALALFQAYANDALASGAVPKGL